LAVLGGLEEEASERLPGFGGKGSLARARGAIGGKGSLARARGVSGHEGSVPDEAWKVQYIQSSKILDTCHISSICGILVRSANMEVPMSNANDPAIAVRGLQKRFGDLEALAGIDFEVAPATVFGLLGPNGAGKTTAVRILTTILEPDGGTAEVLGFDVVRDAERVRLRIGLAGQAATVDPNLTGRENLRLVGRLAQRPRPWVDLRAAELLELFELSPAADRPIRTYSGGMRRRLDVAAALVGRPPVLFLDEPTTGLDLPSRNALWRTIRDLVADGTTVLLTTQYLEEADQLAERIAVVDIGRVIAEGTPSELKAQLGSTVIEFVMAEEPDAHRAASALTSPAGIPEVEGARIRVPSGEGPRALMEMLRTLDAKGLYPVSLTVREPSLDDVFLRLTGHHAEPAPELESTEPVPVGGGA
jgi:ABC-2 type transport system ATP-binding protein